MNIIVQKIICHQFSRPFRIQLRNIHISYINMEEAVNTIKKNPFYEKYQKELVDLQRKSPKEFIQRAINIRQSKLQEQSTFSEKSLDAKAPLSTFKPSLTREKKLDDVLRIQLLEDKSADEIKEIWSQHYCRKEGIFGALSSELYEKIMHRAEKYPMFIYPLPKDQGYEFLLAQFSGNEIHFTSLLNFQAYEENAPENLTIIHYPEFSTRKNIVLMRGEINDKILSTKEGQFLANQVQLYYGKDDQARINLLHEFTHSPKTFDHMKLISHLENINIE